MFSLVLTLPKGRPKVRIFNPLPALEAAPMLGCIQIVRKAMTFTLYNFMRDPLVVN